MAAGKLSQEAWDEIDRFRFATRDVREFRNALIILMSDAGDSRKAIAQDLGCSEATVNNVRRWYREEGLEGLQRQSPPGRESRATPEYRQLLQQVLSTSPLDLGYGFSVWSAARLGEHLKQVTGVSLSVFQLRRIMKQEGFTVQRPKHTMKGKRDEAAYDKARQELDVLKKSHSGPMLVRF